MNGEKGLSLRQVLAAAVLGGLSLTGLAAGRLDWKWALACAAPVGAAILVLFRRRGQSPLFQGPGGGILAVGYAIWSVALMGHVFRSAAQRIQITAGSQGFAIWLMVLLALPVLWMSWGKAEAFFRAAEIFWMVAVVALAAVALLGAPQAEWRYLWKPVGSWWESALTMGGILSTGILILPYIYKIRQEETAGRRQARWLVVLAGAAALMAGLTTGILSPVVAGQVEQPFFVMTGVLGESARAEGLLSALWLIPDLTLAGLLARVWGGGRRPVVAASLGFLLSLTGWTEYVPAPVWLTGNLVLVILTALIPSGKGKIVVSF